MTRFGPRGIAALLVLLGSTFAGIYFATQLWLTYPAPIRRPLNEALAINLTYYWLWGLSVPAVIWIARRFRFERETWPLSTLVHLLWGVALTLTQITIAELILVQTVARASMPKPVWYAMKDNFHSSFPTYFVILFGYYAFDYYRKYRDRELLLSRAQLESLKMQLNPHFLFNSLNTISSLMYRDVDAADAMMTRLSELLRLTLDKQGTHEVTLKEEMDVLERYLDIERIRFEERLRVTIDLEPQTLEAHVPNFSLQPLVENAIKHGIAPRPEGGSLAISALRNDGMLEIRLRDDGPGMHASPRREGIGVANTRARLTTLYGDKHRFEMQNVPEGGLLVTMAVPWHVRQAEVP
ncbi:MAG TPA: histidine kinase [Thermoanaerobaculia bacterium]